MAKSFIGVPSIYPKLLELRQSKTAKFKQNKYMRETTELRYYQVIGSLHMMLLERMILGDGTGLGKTVQGIVAYSLALEKHSDFKLLVVCPKSATSQWDEEFEKFTQGITTRVISNEYKGLKGIDARKLQYEEFNENVLIINYAPVLNEYEMLLETLSPHFMIIYDEVQAFKNRKSKTHFACKFIAQRANRVYGLSATLIKNNLEEVWGVYDVVVPGLFGNITIYVFRKIR